MDYDIFISYKNDGEGNNFAARLKESLDHSGYSVYFNSHEQKAGSFPDRLKDAVNSCKDFILLLSDGCISQLKENHAVDWVREEILCARNAGKNIIPVLIGKAQMPSDKNAFPESLQFLPAQEVLILPEQYVESPYARLLSLIVSNPGKGDYRNISNGNPQFSIMQDMESTWKRAEEGDLEAMYEMGCMYYYGFPENDWSDNYSEACKWLSAVSEKDHPLAKKADILLAKMYYSGEVPREKQSFRKSFEYNMRGQDFKSGAWFESVLFAKSEGIGADFDYEEISSIIDREAEYMPGTVKNIAADFYIRYGDYRKAIDLLEQIDEIIPDAEYKLGELYFRGVHCTPPRPDPYRAEHHFINAADAGFTDAIHKLGLMHFRGAYGYRQNLNKARVLYKDAAQKGHWDAQYDYAWMCRHGLGGGRDIDDALKYFEMGAQKGHFLCMAELATLYQEPTAYRNYQKAFEWAKRATDTGDPYSEFVLGNLYFWGRGCAYNINEAVIHYKNALKAGVNEAEFMLRKIENL